jgi:hypothetical protein
MAPETLTEWKVEVIVNRGGMDPKHHWDRSIRVWATRKDKAETIATRVVGNWADVDRVVSAEATATGKTQ